MNGLTDPFTGGVPCSRVFAHGHTFRWVKGDRYIAVMRGVCVDNRRVLIIHDRFDGQHVFETPQPLVDAIPATHGEWADDHVLRLMVKQWAEKGGGRRGV